jgi:hypothetical protein
MSVERTNDILNRLRVVHACSLPTFLAYARPWWSAAHARATEALADIVADQHDIATRAAQLLVAAGGVVACGRFPDRFSTLHDLSFDFMLAELINYQDRTIAALGRFERELPPGTAGQALAQEALGKATAHRDALADLQSAAAAGTAAPPVTE